ncbi:MAG: aspartate--tRNA ligase, partial [Chloroflexota bacterium]
MLKTHSCGELRSRHIGSQVTLAGWVDRRRDHGGLIFIDLRDREGIAQVVFNPAVSGECHQVGEELRNEYVLRITGTVNRRPPGTENPKLATGEVEVMVEQAEILNRCKTPPFYINEEAEVEENLRLRYRYLDLRRRRMKDNIVLRHKVVKFMRDFLDARGFIEVETPILIKSTPEGARDYLVPSRVHPGKFYALPQSPQQLKQLLMVAGMEKYFQIARCFRDEDTRADRQPEFTQLDLEMSFVEEEDIIRLLEDLFTALVEAVKPEMRLVKPFPRLSYAEAMARYGSDKPDLRFGLELGEVTEVARQTSFGVFTSAIAQGGMVKGLALPGCGGYNRHQLEDLNKLARDLGAAGLVTIALGTEKGSLDNLSPDMVKSIAAKFLTLEQIKAIARCLGAQGGDLLLLVAGKARTVNAVLDGLRREMGRRLGLIDPYLLAFEFIVDFPLFTWNDERGGWESTHHPFTSARDGEWPLLDSDPGKMRAKHYDLVCNGYEIAGGSIR